MVSHWRRCHGLQAVAAFCDEWAERRRSLEFDTDGVVIKVDDLALRAQLGSTAKFPRWATAFKFPAEQATTRLLKIELNVGRTGAVTDRDYFTITIPDGYWLSAVNLLSLSLTVPEITEVMRPAPRAAP